jgi:hypothetical protein
MSKFTCCVDQVANKIPNSPAEIRAGRQVSLPDALPPPFPTRPGSPIPIDPRPEGSLTAEDHVPLWTSEDLTDRRASLTPLRNILQRLLTYSTRHRPGDNGRHAP